MSEQPASNPSEWRAALLAHADYYAEFAASTSEEIMGCCAGKSQLRALARLAPELDNIFLALDIALGFELKSAAVLIRALRLHFYFRGEFGALYRQFEPLLQRVRQSVDSSAQLECLLALAMGAQRTGRTRQFQSYAEEALALASRLPADYRTVDAHNLVGMYWLLQHDFIAARAQFEQMRETAREVKDQIGLANAYGAIGALEKFEGNYARAREALDEALARMGLTENLHSRAFFLNDRASVEYLQGNYAEAWTLFLEALSLMQTCGSKFGQAHVLSYLGNVDAAEGNYEAARATYEQALAIQLEHGHMYEAGTLLLNLGNAALHLGDIEESISRGLAALELLRDAIEPHAVATCLQNLGQAYGRRGDFALAAQAQREALEAHINLEDDESIILNCLVAAEALSLAGLKDAADRIALAVAALAEQRNMVLEVDERQLLDKLLAQRANDVEPHSPSMTVEQLSRFTLDALEEMTESGAQP